MKPAAHLVTSGAISVAVGFWFKSIPCGLAVFVSGVAIDLDHLLDYACTHGFSLNLKKVYYACNNVDLKRLILILHSYELLILFWAAIFAFSLSNVWVALAIGMTQHIIFDQLTNPLNKFGYFLSYRMLKGFKTELLINREGRVVA